MKWGQRSDFERLASKVCMRHCNERREEMTSLRTATAFDVDFIWTTDEAFELGFALGGIIKASRVGKKQGI